MVTALVEAGRDLSFPAQADPAIRAWGEEYAVEVAERAWLNVSFWYRWMDHFGLPRTMVTEGVGGHAGRPADARHLPGRLLASVPRLLWFQGYCLRSLPGPGRTFRQLDRTITEARGLRPGDWPSCTGRRSRDCGWRCGATSPSTRCCPASSGCAASAACRARRASSRGT
jgi:hypothetical protein